MVLAELIGESPGIVALREQVDRLVRRRTAGERLPQLLLAGETGTGKGLLARALHAASPRRDAPFVDINCAAIPENLLEAELFGVERGAYTGADRSRPGLFQIAHGGTLFLDEIALLPPPLQGKLLKALEERRVRRVGSTRFEKVDAWILAATNEDLDEAMRTGRFRRDLYHRLGVVTLHLPPLRDRGADVITLAEHFLARSCADYGRPSKALAQGAQVALRTYAWPGNVRELANLIERAALLSEESLLTPSSLDLPAAPSVRRERARPEAATGLRAVVGAAERERLLDALEATGWNLSRAAARLQIPRNTLRYRMERHALREPPPSRRRPSVAGTGAVGERRRLALLCVAITAEPGGEARVARALDDVTEKIETFGGRIEEVSPAGLVAAFGVEPVEDAPRRAALAAIAAQKTVERTWRDQFTPSIAAAIHVHELVLTPSPSGAELEPGEWDVARRSLESLVALALPSGVLVGDAAAAFLRRRFDLSPAAVSRDDIGRAYVLTGRERTGFGPAGRATEFTGRRQELGLLQSRLAAVQSGLGQVVAIVGDAASANPASSSSFARASRGTGSPTSRAAARRSVRPRPICRCSTWYGRLAASRNRTGSLRRRMSFARCCVHSRSSTIRRRTCCRSSAAATPWTARRAATRRC